MKPENNAIELENALKEVKAIAVQFLVKAALSLGFISFLAVVTPVGSLLWCIATGAAILVGYHMIQQVRDYLALARQFRAHAGLAE